MIDFCTEMPTIQRSRALGETAKFWETGQRLYVAFVGGQAWMHNHVKAAAAEWMRYANINFVFAPNKYPHIRIGFDQHAGHWSMVGRDSALVTGASMNLAYTGGYGANEYMRVALHELGHALGLVHEHQSPFAPIPWDKERVYEFYMQTQGWDRAAVDINILQHYAQAQVQGTEPDRESIMLYPIPPELTNGAFGSGWNHVLSPADKAFIGRIYPFQTVNETPPNSAIRNGDTVEIMDWVNLRRTPGYLRKPQTDIVRVMAKGTITKVIGYGQVSDSLRWWPVAGGWLAERSASGKQLLQRVL